VWVVWCPAGREQEVVAGVLLGSLLELVLLMVGECRVPVARAGYALLLRFSQYMLWCC